MAMKKINKNKTIQKFGILFGIFFIPVLLFMLISQNSSKNIDPKYDKNDSASSNGEVSTTENGIMTTFSYDYPGTGFSFNYPSRWESGKYQGSCGEKMPEFYLEDFMRIVIDNCSEGFVNENLKILSQKKINVDGQAGIVRELEGDVVSPNGESGYIYRYDVIINRNSHNSSKDFIIVGSLIDSWDLKSKLKLRDSVDSLVSTLRLKN